MCLHACNTPQRHKCCIQMKTFHAQIITKRGKTKDDNVEVNHLGEKKKSVFSSPWCNTGSSVWLEALAHNGLRSRLDKLFPGTVFTLAHWIQRSGSKIIQFFLLLSPTPQRRREEALTCHVCLSWPLLCTIRLSVDPALDAIRFPRAHCHGLK